MGRRSKIVLTADTAEKHYRDAELCVAEVAAWRQVPYACPELLDYRDASPLNGYEAVMVSRRHPVANRTPRWRDPEGLLGLLLALHADGWAHRDLHLGNVVQGPDGPLLIDLEHLHPADPMAPPYDLFGSARSGLPKPPGHWQDHCWDFDGHSSVKNGWVPLAAVLQSITCPW